MLLLSQVEETGSKPASKLLKTVWSVASDTGSAESSLPPFSVGYCIKLYKFFRHISSDFCPQLLIFSWANVPLITDFPRISLARCPPQSTSIHLTLSQSASNHGAPPGSVAKTWLMRLGKVLRLGSLLKIGMRGFEPPAPSSRTKCATKLRYIPAWIFGLRELMAASRLGIDLEPVWNQSGNWLGPYFQDSPPYPTVSKLPQGRHPRGQGQGICGGRYVLGEGRRYFLRGRVPRFVKGG